MHIDSNFDSGNIEIVELGPGNRADLRIKKDVGDEHMQWFHFRVDGMRDEPCTLRIINDMYNIPSRGGHSSIDRSLVALFRLPRQAVAADAQETK